MTSNINPNNINGAYPVAGQDNDSQGFRDNFTSIRTNFSAAAAEISDLQAKAVLTAPLTNTVNPPSPWLNNMAGSIISNGLLRQMRDVAVGPTTISAGATATLDFSSGSYQRITPQGSISVSFLNIPASGQVARMRLQITIASPFDIATHSITFPATVSVGTGQIQGWSGTTLTFNQTGVFEYELEFAAGSSGAATIISLTRNPDPLYLPSVQTFAANGAVDLARASTVITSSADLVGTMAAGTSGQLKVLAYGNTSTGNTRITVTNSAWGGSNLVTLTARGSACTLQYINGQWFAVGNNGATFS